MAGELNATVLESPVAAASVAAAEVFDFEHFAQALTERLVRLARNLLRDPYHAEDVAQNALVKIYLRWDRVARMEFPEAYAKRLVVRECQSWWRRPSRREAAESDPLVDSALNADHAGALTERDAILRSIRQLSPKQRTVLVLRYYEDLPDSKIGTLLGMREATVRSHAFHGLARLRDLLA